MINNRYTFPLVKKGNYVYAIGGRSYSKEGSEGILN